MTMRAYHLLVSIYADIYNKNPEQVIDYTEFDERLNIQKTVYLLQEMGVNFGNYDFTWYNHGPYSQSLQNDAFKAWERQTNPIPFNFSDYVGKQVSAFRTFIKQKPAKYTQSQWLEAIASLHYMLVHEAAGYSDEYLLRELTVRKPHLNNKPGNTKALKIAHRIAVTKRD